MDLICAPSLASIPVTDSSQRFFKNINEFTRLQFHFTTKLIGDPAMTLAPAGGSCEMMIDAGDDVVAMSGPGAPASACGPELSGEGDGTATVILPTENPASCSAFVTVPNGWPTKLGMTN